MARILIVEDETEIAEALEYDLKLEGYEVEVVHDGESASLRGREPGWDLILPDIMLPKKDGFDVCRELRTAGVRASILFLTARTHEAEIIQGLDLGADDYITKPFSARELRARIRARLRSGQPPDEDVLRCAEIEIDTARVEVRKGGEKADVTPQEFKLLVTFARNPGRVLSRDQLIDLAWGGDTFVTDRAVDAHVVNLRRKLGPELIASVRGMGYRFDG
ncbi:MAG TPA: response regulator transcription factor [Gemmatimonadaceae bacterium]|nr:response regulator transcription factor [Gemmatimonadaceae bacterium]